MICKTKYAGSDVIIVTKLTPDFLETEGELRAVYLSLRPCLQSFRGSNIKYLNLFMRPFRNYKPFCHWGIYVSPHFPEQILKSGTDYLPSECLYECSSSFELEVPKCRVNGKKRKPNVGCFEPSCPTKTSARRRVVYIGQTNKSDAEISYIADRIKEYINTHEGYHGLFRNCQHFAIFLLKALCFEGKHPSSTDRICGGILGLLNPNSWNMKREMKKFWEFYEKGKPEDPELLRKAQMAAIAECRTKVRKLDQEKEK